MIYLFKENLAHFQLYISFYMLWSLELMHKITRAHRVFALYL